MHRGVLHICVTFDQTVYKLINNAKTPNNLCTAITLCTRYIVSKNKFDSTSNKRVPAMYHKISREKKTTNNIQFHDCSAHTKRKPRARVTLHILQRRRLHCRSAIGNEAIIRRRAPIIWLWRSSCYIYYISTRPKWRVRSSLTLPVHCAVAAALFEGRRLVWFLDRNETRRRRRRVNCCGACVRFEKNNKCFVSPRLILHWSYN